MRKSSVERCSAALSSLLISVSLLGTGSMVAGAQDTGVPNPDPAVIQDSPPQEPPALDVPASPTPQATTDPAPVAPEPGNAQETPPAAPPEQQLPAQPGADASPAPSVPAQPAPAASAPAAPSAEPVPASSPEPSAPVEVAPLLGESSTATSDGTVGSEVDPQAAQTRAVPSTSTIEGQLFVMINNYRASKGLKQLAWNDQIAAVSEAWSQTMVNTNTFKHNPNYTTQMPKGWNRAGENIAANYDAEKIFQSWVNSPAHNANMLTPEYNYTGFGAVQETEGTYKGMWYATNNFGYYPNGVTGTSTGGTTYNVSGAIATKYQSMGGSTSFLGQPTANQVSVAGGVYQQFQGGRIYSSAAGAFIVTGVFVAPYDRAGGPAGSLGFPTSDATCGLVSGGCVQSYQQGRMAYSPGGGSRVMFGAIAAKWTASGAQNGPLGYPNTDQICTLPGGGCLQGFFGGGIYSGTTGTFFVSGAMYTGYAQVGGPWARLALPTSDTLCGMSGGGCIQTFQGGSIAYYSPNIGPAAMFGNISAKWIATGAQDGSLRYPNTAQICTLPGGGCLQGFMRGGIYSGVTGTFSVTGAIYNKYAQVGGPWGTVGLPTGNMVPSGTGYVQTFQRGKIFWSPTTGAVLQ